MNVAITQIVMSTCTSDVSFRPACCVRLARSNMNRRGTQFAPACIHHNETKRLPVLLVCVLVLACCGGIPNVWATPTVFMTSPQFTSSNIITFNISFAVPISGLSPNSFHVTTDAAVVGRVLEGGGDSYTLKLTLAPNEFAPCPSNWTFGAGPSLCGRVTQSPTTHSGSSTQCSPGTLMAVTSQEANEFANSLQPAANSMPWCAARLLLCECAHVPDS